MTTDMLALTDTVAVFGANFGIADENLHGEKAYVLDEFDARRELIKEALKLLVTQNLVRVKKYDDGFHYSVSDNGRTHSAEFDSEYAAEYLALAKKASDYTQGKTERELFKIMSKRT
ncbi:hypothetical protein FACS1894132_13930 [Clostridia bacterium]|nr:hypothetical protein FACS1894132_13930 [Clostridia bacterium]